jgi:hypothetical protein
MISEFFRRTKLANPTAISAFSAENYNRKYKKPRHLRFTGPLEAHFLVENLRKSRIFFLGKFEKVAENC